MADPQPFNYTPPSASGYFPADLFNAGAGQPGYQGQVTQPNFQVKVLQNRPEGQILAWRLILEDVRGGLNATVVPYNGYHDRVYSSTLDTRFARTLILPQKLTTSSTPDPGGTIVGLHSVNIFNRLMWGAGSSNGSCLFREASISDPTPTAVSGYNSTSAITSMGLGVIGGATAAQRLIISRLSNNMHVISDSVGTVAGTMHNDTNPGWGVIQTFVNDNLLLIYANGAIRYLRATDALTDQPSVGLSSVPNGGFPLGMIKLAGAPLRPTWVWPYQDTTGGMLANGSESPGHVVQTNVEATDYQEIPMGIKYIYWAVNVNGNAIVASDRERIMYYDGKFAARDLTWIANREPNSDYIYEARGGFVNGNELWVFVNKRKSTNGTGNTQFWWEVYNFETNAWHQVSAATTGSTTGSMGLMAGGALPYSATTGFHLAYVDGSWRQQFAPVYGYNPFDLYRQTSGSQSSTGNEYEASGTYKSPYWELPGLEGWPKLTTRIFYLGDVDAGGTASTAATATITAGNLSGTFATGLPQRAQLVNMSDNLDLWYKLQVQVDLARTSASTRYTPNGLPLIIEGVCFVGALQPMMDWMDDIR